MMHLIVPTGVTADITVTIGVFPLFSERAKARVESCAGCGIVFGTSVT